MGDQKDSDMLYVVIDWQRYWKEWVIVSGLTLIKNLAWEYWSESVNYLKASFFLLWTVGKLTLNERNERDKIEVCRNVDKLNKLRYSTQIKHVWIHPWCITNLSNCYGITMDWHSKMLSLDVNSSVIYSNNYVFSKRKIINTIFLWTFSQAS